MIPEEPIPAWKGPGREKLKEGSGAAARMLLCSAINNSQVYGAPGTREAVPLPNLYFPREIAGAEGQQLPRYSIYMHGYVF